ncbi:DMT family transporter [Ekhidna sp. To15]|uniref:DMT family transporter n=1 Tax=Ekhidna sp. To15 TaxID=3395267 RepID=UPI003F524435
MRLSSTSLFIIPALIWGSTFFVIKFQLGAVDPTWSVSYRFILAGLLLLVYSKFKGLNLQFDRMAHMRMILQGALLFGFNYWFVYIAEQELISALVAIMFSCIIFLNAFFGKLFLGKIAERKVYFGAILGIAGTLLLFKQELLGLGDANFKTFHLTICFISVIAASLGNITSAFNQSKGMPVIQTNAFGMLYGGLIIALMAFISGAQISFDIQFEYISSLLYLSLFGSIIAFGSYLTLIGKIGADKAGYVLVVIPVIAVTLSVIFEDYLLGWHVLVGMILILLGNIIVLKK